MYELHNAVKEKPNNSHNMYTKLKLLGSIVIITTGTTLMNKMHSV